MIRFSRRHLAASAVLAASLERGLGVPHLSSPQSPLVSYSCQNDPRLGELSRVNCIALKERLSATRKTVKPKANLNFVSFPLPNWVGVLRGGGAGLTLHSHRREMSTSRPQRGMLDKI